jgi:dihydroorotate dehydrogenase
MDLFQVFKRLLFLLDPESAHHLILNLLTLAGSLKPLRSWMRRLFVAEDPEHGVRVYGLEFPNRVGMAAGFDKDGQAIRGLACLGFGHIELGTVTPAAQPGNPRPRVFRLPHDQALINRLGFPNAGAEALLRRLKKWRPKDVVLGVNLGKGIDTPLDRAADDYLYLARVFHALADYLVINVSSPNTLGLRRLQARDYLESLLEGISQTRAGLVKGEERKLPILVKLAPDLGEGELADALGAIEVAGMDGVIATNTTVQRSGLHSPMQNEVGGLSGAPLRERSTEIIRSIHRLSEGRLPIIGVGGISGPQDALEKLQAGAALVQIYTGLIYRGPGLVRNIVNALREG